jgi:hypothetical protein
VSPIVVARAVALNAVAIIMAAAFTIPKAASEAAAKEST